MTTSNAQDTQNQYVLHTTIRCTMIIMMMSGLMTATYIGTICTSIAVLILILTTFFFLFFILKVKLTNSFQNYLPSIFPNCVRYLNHLNNFLSLICHQFLFLFDLYTDNFFFLIFFSQ